MTVSPSLKALLNLSLVVAALWTVRIAHGATLQWGQPVTGVQLGVEVEERPFQPGERIPLSVKFTNTTAMPRFPVGPIHLAGQVTVLDAGKQIVRRREDVRREAQAKAGKITGPMRLPPPMYGAAIKPGGILGYAVDLARDFALDQPGTYTVSVTGQVLSGMPFEPNSVTHSLTSAPVVIQIVSNAPPPLAVVAPPASSRTNPPVAAINPVVPPPSLPPAPVVEAPPPRPAQTPTAPVMPAAPPRSTSMHFSGSLVMAGIFGVLGLLVLYAMFRSDPR